MIIVFVFQYIFYSILSVNSIQHDMHVCMDILIFYRYLLSHFLIFLFILFICYLYYLYFIFPILPIPIKPNYYQVSNTVIAHTLYTLPLPNSKQSHNSIYIRNIIHYFLINSDIFSSSTPSIII